MGRDQKLSRHRRGNPPRNPLLDRFILESWRVYYGPNPHPVPDSGEYEWACQRCERRRTSHHAKTGGYTATLDLARQWANFHRREHWFMRAIYKEAAGR